MKQMKKFSKHQVIRKFQATGWERERETKQEKRTIKSIIHRMHIAQATHQKCVMYVYASVELAHLLDIQWKSLSEWK